MESPKHDPVRTSRIPLFGNLRILCVAALLTALSIVLGKYLAISTPIFRFSLENLPILLAGVFFGPVVGGAVGLIADLVGCVMVGYTINPLVALGGTLVGVLSGTVVLISRRGGRPLKPAAIVVAVAVAHVVGSMVVKTIGLAIYYGTPAETLVWRVPLYIVIGALEGTVIILLSLNTVFTRELNRLLLSKKGRRS